MRTGRVSWIRLRTPVLWLVLLVAMGTLSLYASAYTVIMVTNILMYVILTMSWVLFSAPTGYISLATAAFFGVGIYTAAILGEQLPLPLVILTAGLASFCLAALVGALTLRLKGVYFAFFTFGLVELIKYLLLWYEVNVTGVRGRFVAFADNVTIYYVILGILVALLLTSYLIRRSRIGLALQSIGEGEDAAAHIGINVSAVKTIVFATQRSFRRGGRGGHGQTVDLRRPVRRLRLPLLLHSGRDGCLRRAGAIRGTYPGGSGFCLPERTPHHPIPLRLHAGHGLCVGRDHPVPAPGAGPVGAEVYVAQTERQS